MLDIRSQRHLKPIKSKFILCAQKIPFTINIYMVYKCAALCINGHVLKDLNGNRFVAVVAVVVVCAHLKGDTLHLINECGQILFGCGCAHAVAVCG